MKVLDAAAAGTAVARVLRSLVVSLFLSSSIAPVAVMAQAAPGYDVFLLVGQSNMVGYGTGADNAADAAVSPRVYMWDANNSVISPAKDPLVQNQVPGYVGMGLTFGKAYAASLAANRNVLLVGSATGSTSFLSGRWLAPNGDLATTAVARANAAMAAAGAGARFAGILWHQGESDYGNQANAYSTDLIGLTTFFRTHITGASSATPFVVGEWTYQFLNYNISVATNIATQAAILQGFHILPDWVPNTAWVSSAGLLGDTDQWGTIHFSALSQRQFGRRYADRMFEAINGLPQPETSLKAWSGTFYDDGRSYNSTYNTSNTPVNANGVVQGTVTIVADAVRGSVAQISQGQGSINYTIPSSTFNGSYTKMVWFKPGASGYINNLISGLNPGQGHYLAATNSGGSISVQAGHWVGSSLQTFINKPIASGAGTWVNLCVVYDAVAQTMTLSVNGAAVQTASGVASAPALSGGPVTLSMGTYGNYAGTGVDGSMAGNRVWNTPLTAAMVNQIYNYELNYGAGW